MFFSLLYLSHSLDSEPEPWNKDFFSDYDDDANNNNNGQDNHDKDNNDKNKDTTNMTNNMKVERLGGLLFA